MSLTWKNKSKQTNYAEIFHRSFSPKETCNCRQTKIASCLARRHSIAQHPPMVSTSSFVNPIWKKLEAVTCSNKYNVTTQRVLMCISLLNDYRDSCDVIKKKTQMFDLCLTCCFRSYTQPVFIVSAILFNFLRTSSTKKNDVTYHIKISRNLLVFNKNYLFYDPYSFRQ